MTRAGEKWSEKRQRVSSCRSQTRDNGDMGNEEEGGVSERPRGRDGTLERGQIVSSRGDGKISAEIPLNAYLPHFKGARHVRQISILLKAPKKRESRGFLQFIS